MQYHIQTTPVWDAFKTNCGCPLCKIYAVSNERLVSQYLNEAVMEPDFRVRVNKLGFCDMHLRQLFAGKNKLGLGLQLNTRTDHVIKKLANPSNIKAAKKEAEIIRGSLKTCVICETVDEMMTRYAYTVAQMYLNEKAFPELFKNSKGFCMPHYALLLENAHRAGKMTEEYLAALVQVQKSSLIKVNADTERFTLMFDHNSTDKGMKGAADIIPAAIAKLKGEIL